MWGDLSVGSFGSLLAIFDAFKKGSCRGRPYKILQKIFTKNPLRQKRHLEYRYIDVADGSKTSGTL
jgi:hypothetical protein